MHNYEHLAVFLLSSALRTLEWAAPVPMGCRRGRTLLTSPRQAVPQIYPFSTSKNGVLWGPDGQIRILLVNGTWFKIFTSHSFPGFTDLCDAVRIGCFSGDLTGISGSHVGAINTALPITFTLPIHARRIIQGPAHFPLKFHILI